MDRDSLLLFLTICIFFHLIPANELNLAAEMPMIFPLSYSSLPPRVEDIRRRRLQSQFPNAHMKLYDGLLANGYYTTRLWIGTPPQEFALIVDTGSTVTYVPCSTCKQCGKHHDPKFQPELSSSYQALKCNPDCNCDDEGKLCGYERRYAEMSSSSGVLSEDLISFGNESQLTPQKLFLDAKMQKQVTFLANVLYKVLVSERFCCSHMLLKELQTLIYVVCVMVVLVRESIPAQRLLSGIREFQVQTMRKTEEKLTDEVSLLILVM